DRVGDAVGEIELGAVVPEELDHDVVPCGALAGEGEVLVFEVDGDDAARAEDDLQEAEGAAGAAAHVHDDREFPSPIANEALEIEDRNLQDGVEPRIGPEKPAAEPRFGDEERAFVRARGGGEGGEAGGQGESAAQAIASTTPSSSATPTPL